MGEGNGPSTENNRSVKEHAVFRKLAGGAARGQ